MSSPEQYEHDFASASAGASTSVPCKANDLRQGGHVLLGDKPCKIVSITKSKPGKHGHAKIVVTGIDIFTGKKYDGGGPASHNMMVPVILRTRYPLLNIERDGFMSLFDTQSGTEKMDVPLPDGELGDKITQMFKIEAKSVTVVVLSAMGKDIAVDAIEMED